MDLYVYNLDEYTSDSRQGNEYAPSWPFRMIVVGSSDSGKTTMIINLLMGNKKIKEDGERYILCNDVVLIGKFLDEPKWAIVENFYNELSETEDVTFKKLAISNGIDDIPSVEGFNPQRSTVVIFEDLMNMSKKIQECISDYFSSGRHANISPIYVSQRFFAIPKTIRDNITYISLHVGGGSLFDIKKIIKQYTEHSETLAPIIDEITLKKEFIVFDLRRSKNDPLSIRVRWDTSLRAYIDEMRTNNTPNTVNVIENEIASKFSSYGQKVVREAKKNGLLIDFAKNMPSPKERKILLAEGVKTKNSDIWARYVFREAYGITGKDLGPEWKTFVNDKNSIVELQTDLTEDTNSIRNKYLERYKELLEMCPLDDDNLIEGCKILLWLFSNGFTKRKHFITALNEIISN